MKNWGEVRWEVLDVPTCNLGESPRYAHGMWVWLDIHQRKMFACAHSDLIGAQSLSSSLQSIDLPDEIACVLPTASPEQWIGLGRAGVWKISGVVGHTLGTDLRFTFEHLQKPTYDAGLHRYNDGRADAQGRIWISSLVDARAPASAALYRLDAHGPEQLVDNLIVGNGLAFTPDGKAMFLADTRHKCIWLYDYDLSLGKLGTGRVVHRYTEGSERPDGACMSMDGSYWVAILEGYRLDRFSSSGQWLESIPLPLAKPTMPCFGGKDLSTLLVTSARPDAQHPNHKGFEDASVIACSTDLNGVPEGFVRWS